MERRIFALANSLSSHCLSCGAACCRTGKIALGPNDAHRFQKKLMQPHGLVVVELALGCEHLQGSRCQIYLDRPEVCSSFPLFLRYKTLFVAEACLAIKAGVLDEELKQLQIDFPVLKVFRQ